MWWPLNRPWLFIESEPGPSTLHIERPWHNGLSIMYNCIGMTTGILVVRSPNGGGDLSFVHRMIPWTRPIIFFVHHSHWRMTTRNTNKGNRHNTNYSALKSCKVGFMLRRPAITSDSSSNNNNTVPVKVVNWCIPFLRALYRTTAANRGSNRCCLPLREHFSQP